MNEVIDRAQKREFFMKLNNHESRFYKTDVARGRQTIGLPPALAAVVPQRESGRGGILLISYQLLVCSITESSQKQEKLDELKKPTVFPPRIGGGSQQQVVEPVKQEKETSDSCRAFSNVLRKNN
ncbi:Hypothetical protein NTJ_15255 [Nesidiocoris tenuis]|uniref:Uncharacterized protein n=1 Tax=Nesidiocoris tenuis TaxID=355587 RepID=A0ABN7BGS4_9HEMI|nr:Hypothetical protein NTJ_15255 [Nesidiocoris tenuis]